MKKILFVLNPNSGKAKIKNELLDIIKIFTDDGYDVTVYPTKAPMDGYEYVKKKGMLYKIVVCSGGDGTLNEVVSAVVEIPDAKKPYIGYIPSGSTNDFANTLGIPSSSVAAADLIVKGKPFSCDIGKFNGRNFNYVAAFGAFTEVSYSTPQEIKNILGHQAYVLEAVKSIIDIKPVHIKAITDEGVVEGDFIYGMVSNSRSIGGITNMVSEKIELNDGLFELTLIKAFKNPIEAQQFMADFISQNIHENELVYKCKSSSFIIESDEKMNWVLDGEYGGEWNRVQIEVQNKIVQFIV